MDDFKGRLLEQFAHLAKGLANGNRLALLELLAQGERTVEALAKAAGLPVANTSQHLQVLRRAGLVQASKTGRRVAYRVAGNDVTNLIASLRRVAETRLADVDRIIEAYLKSRDRLEPISAEELLRRAKRNEVTILDTRPAEEYASGHIPGAMNIPVGELERRLKELPRKHEIVAYCRGPYCVLSFDAVNWLRKKGYRAVRLEDGYPEWKAAGLAVDV